MQLTQGLYEFKVIVDGQNSHGEGCVNVTVKPGMFLSPDYASIAPSEDPKEGDLILGVFNFHSFFKIQFLIQCRKRYRVATCIHTLALVGTLC